MRNIFLLLILLLAQQVCAQPSGSNRQPKKQQSPPQAVIVVTPQPTSQTESTTEAERSSIEKERYDQQVAFQQEQLRQNQTVADATFWIAIITGVNLLVAGIFAVIAFFQFGKLRDQTNHAGDQAQAMKDGLEETRKLGGHNEQVIRAMNDQLGVMIDQQKYWAKAEIAYFGVKIEGADEERENVIKVWIWFTNSGRTPAWQFVTKAVVAPELKDYRWEDTEKDTLSFVPATERMSACFYTQKLSNEVKDAVLSGTQLLFVDGEGRYFDVTGKRQCFRYGYDFNARTGVSVMRYHHQYEPDKQEKSSEKGQNPKRQNPN